MAGGAGAAAERKGAVRNFGKRGQRRGQCPVATGTTAAGQPWSHTPPPPGAARRPYLPGVRVRARESLAARSRSPRGRDHLKTGKPRPTCGSTTFPPPRHFRLLMTYTRQRKSRLPPESNSRCPKRFVFYCRLSAQASFLPKSDSQRGSWEMQAALGGRCLSGRGAMTYPAGSAR